MKSVIVSFVWAVGMNHWGPRELQVGTAYFGKHEENNQYDCNAIAVCEEKNLRRKLAYVRKSDAKFVAQLFRENLIDGPCYFKCKSAIEVFKRGTGPQQKLNLGFKSNYIPVVTSIYCLNRVFLSA